VQAQRFSTNHLKCLTKSNKAWRNIMSYKLVLTERPAEGQKDVGENVYLDGLPTDYKVYGFYYAGAVSNEALEKKLRELGDITGKNFFVNIGRLSDPRHDEIVERFAIKKYPVIVVTAIDALASPAGEYLTVYARLDSRQLLDSPERTIKCVQELFNLFMQGKVSEAISHASWKQRAALVAKIGRFFSDTLKGLLNFIAESDISISVVEGKFELKHSGD
jgi:hypothetical protein